MYSSRLFTSELYFNHGQDELKCPHKRRRCVDIRRKRNRNLRSNYGGQFSWLEGGLSDFVFQEVGSLTPAQEVHAFIQNNDEGLSERVQSVMTEFEYILL